MIKEHERAILTVDLPDYHLKAGDIGIVVHVYTNKTAYEVEFFAVDGHTLDVVTVEAQHLRPVSNLEILHARPLQS
jgi:hypothetical protein